MNFKLQNKESLEQQVQIASSDLELFKDEELEAISEGGFDELLKNRSVRGKVAKWAAVAVSVVGISVGMVMPAHAVIQAEQVNSSAVRPARAVNRTNCQSDTFNISQGPGGDKATMCFANAGESRVVIADVHRIFSGNNAGFVVTNKGKFKFGKRQGVEFIKKIGTVTILTIHIN